MSYRGRFAPTPSGPLHMGSLFTALASYLRARDQNGQWLIRIDDLDTPRNVPGADTVILKQLESHGLEWNETPRYQTTHIEQYRSALNDLQERGNVYGCTCTRAELALTSHAGPDGPVYAGICRGKNIGNEKHALRVSVTETSLSFKDLLLGQQTRQLRDEIGDFIVQRSDGILGYQLACAIDESEQGITEVLRGADLLDSTFRQLYLQQLLGLIPAQYGHLPVLIQADGKKLSKQNHADPIDASSASGNLMRCLISLGQNPPAELVGAAPREILNWATGHWQLALIPHKSALQWSNGQSSGIL